MLRAEAFSLLFGRVTPYFRIDMAKEALETAGIAYMIIRFHPPTRFRPVVESGMVGTYTGPSMVPTDNMIAAGMTTVAMVAQ